jgi:hypothetical protein
VIYERRDRGKLHERENAAAASRAGARESDRFSPHVRFGQA